MMILGAAAFGAGAAWAGECPAGKLVADGQGQKMVGTPASGVTDVVVSSIDVASEKSVMVQGRLFRGRRLDIMPGGVVPWHSHSDRPALLLIAEGEITEYASTCAVPIVHKAGEITPEKAPTSHWWRNHGKVPVVIYAFDLFRVEDRKNEHMM
jgi:quercetin dioxygenase-like cupin family protein